MKSENVSRRFIYRTIGVCPPEIHFQLDHRIVEEVRFVGGGCPGNARLVSRLIRGKSVDEVLPVLKGIDCREKGSCPGQLANALKSALSGDLSPSDTYRIHEETTPNTKVGIVGPMNGDPRFLDKMMSSMGKNGIETVYCLGNFTGNTGENKAVIQWLRQHKKVICVQGEQDGLHARCAPVGLTPLATRDRDWLAMLPQVLTFRLGNRKVLMFYGEYLQDLPGFSDFDPYALEINMVCGLTDFMRDETVFPALEAMTPQFHSDIILFGQRGDWGQWCVSGKKFISLGGFVEQERGSWGILESTADGIRFDRINAGH